MRKGQAQILKRAQKDGFSKRKIDFLKNEKMTVEELENSYRFFYFCPDAKVEDYLWMCNNKEYVSDNICYWSDYPISSIKAYVEALKNMQKSGKYSISEFSELTKFCNYLLWKSAKNIRKDCIDIDLIDVKVLVNMYEKRKSAGLTEKPNYYKDEYFVPRLYSISYLTLDEKVNIEKAVMAFYDNRPNFEISMDLVLNEIKYMYPYAVIIHSLTGKRCCYPINEVTKQYFKRQYPELAKNKQIKREEQSHFDKKIVNQAIDFARKTNTRELTISGIFYKTSFYLYPKYFSYEWKKYESMRIICRCGDDSKEKSYNSYFINPFGQMKLLFYYDYGVYKIVGSKNGKNNDTKCIPATINDLAEFYFLSKETKSVVEAYCKNCIKQGWFIWEDILDMLQKGARDFPPVRVKDALKTKNKNHMMTTAYAHADFINWNNPENDMYLNYLAMRTFSWINDNSRSVLLDYVKNCSKSDKEKYSGLQSRSQLLVDVLWSRVKRDDGQYWETGCRDGKVYFADESQAKIVINDYVRMSRILHKKVNLKFTSAKKIKETHDDLMVRVKNKHTPKITIPKNSKFKELRKILPKEFEWITTKQRIIKEGIDMHHCVATYADSVNKDQCAIYSFLYFDQNRYTIEFRKRKGEYYIEQIQSRCDRGCPKDVWDYVERLLKNNDSQKAA